MAEEKRRKRAEMRYRIDLRDRSPDCGPPLTNIESYTGFLKVMAERTEPESKEREPKRNAEIGLQYISALEESERNCIFWWTAS